MFRHLRRHGIWRSGKLKFDFLKNQELLKWNKKHFSLFHEFSHLDLQKKLEKM